MAAAEVTGSAHGQDDGQDDAKATKDRSRDLLVIVSGRDFTCADCGAAHDRGELLTMDDAGPLCMACADLSHLEFLARGDTALTRRARKHSTLSAVVVKWSRPRRRYERQGIVAEPDAIERAEQECLADAEARERRRIRAMGRRDDRTTNSSTSWPARSLISSPPARRAAPPGSRGMRGSAAAAGSAGPRPVARLTRRPSGWPSSRPFGTRTPRTTNS